MRSRLKRMLAVMFIAAMTTIPAFSSLAAEGDIPEFSPFAGFEGIDPVAFAGYPFDISNPFWPGWSFGMASPSNMMPGFIPGMDQSFWGDPQNPGNDTFTGEFGNPWGNFENPDDYVFVPDETLLPGIIPLPNAEGAYDLYIEDEDGPDTDVSAAEVETADDIYAPEDDTWIMADDEDSGNGDYVKLQIYNISGKASSDTLEADYIERLFYGEPDTTPFSDYWRSVLNRDEQNFYDDLKEFIQEIAASDETYPVFDAAGAAPSVRLSKAQLGLPDDTKNPAWCEAALDHYLENVINIGKVTDYLYRDDPSYLYWMDGSYAVLFSASVEDDYCAIIPTSIYFPPQTDWEGDHAGWLGSYEIVSVDNEDIITAAKAAQNAWEIVEDHLEEPESEMMASFGEAISRIITYDSEKDADSSDYDDPWMLVYVFDNDPLTTVTGVGYDKALFCLREMSGIDNAGADAAAE